MYVMQQLLNSLFPELSQLRATSQSELPGIVLDAGCCFSHTIGNFKNKRLRFMAIPDDAIKY